MNISYGEVEALCNELHALAKNMKETLESVEDSGNKVTMDSSWNGPAANYYREKIKSITKDFDEIMGEIENSILYMAKCSDGYQAIDETIMREICANLNITQPNLNTSNIFNG